MVPEVDEQGSPGKAAKFHQESRSSGKIMVTCRSEAKPGVQVRIRSDDDEHSNIGPRDHQEGS